MRKHVRGDLVGFKIRTVNRMKGNFESEILIGKNQLRHPYQHIDDDQILDNRRERIGPGKSKLTHSANLGKQSGKGGRIRKSDSGLFLLAAKVFPKLEHEDNSLCL